MIDPRDSLIATTSQRPVAARAASATGFGRPSVLVTLPIYNEAPRLQATVHQIVEAFDASKMDYQLAFAEEGSTDGTKEILADLTKGTSRLVVWTQTERRGRGFALRSLWEQCPADVYVFSDVDLATGVESVLSVTRQVLAGDPVVIGSRYVSGATVNRPPLRSAVSIAYNRLIRTMFRESIQDHQCGLKAFSRAAIEAVLPLTKEDSWFWDTEVLVVCARLGIPVSEIPVNWVETKTHRTRVKRLLKDVCLHGSGLLRLKGEIDRRVRGSSRSVTFNLGTGFFKKDYGPRQ
jgi:glycosyltransferase involved in cell wall biosynthesis